MFYLDMCLVFSQVFRSSAAAVAAAAADDDDDAEALGVVSRFFFWSG